LRWRSAGVDEAIAEPCLPFFIEWDEGARLPGTEDPRPATISRLVLEGSPDRLAAWLGEHSLPIRVLNGPAEVAAVVLSTSAGEIICERRRPPAKPGPWAQRILRAVLPAGVVLLVIWLVDVAAALVIGGEQVGLTIAQAVFGLLTSLILIVSGYQYRKHLGEG
jgi:hypothetical protein